MAVSFKGVVPDHVDIHRLVLVSNPRSRTKQVWRKKIQAKLWREIRIRRIMPIGGRRAMPRMFKIGDREGSPRLLGGCCNLV